jgi:hypothetical protein
MPYALLKRNTSYEASSRAAPALCVSLPPHLADLTFVCHDMLRSLHRYAGTFVTVWLKLAARTFEEILSVSCRKAGWFSTGIIVGACPLTADRSPGLRLQTSTKSIPNENFLLLYWAVPLNTTFSRMAPVVSYASYVFAGHYCYHPVISIELRHSFCAQPLNRPT